MKPPSLRAASRHRRLTFALFTAPGLSLYSLFFIAPVLLGVYYSLHDWNGFSKKFAFVGLGNYAAILGDARFLRAMAFNLRYSLMLMACVLAIALLLALLLDERAPGITFFRAAYFFPAVLSSLTVGLIFNQIFYRALPPLGQALGIEALSRNILSSKSTAVFGVLFVHLWQGVAMPTILFLAGLQTIPRDLYEAASLDGAGPLQKLRYITVPFLLPVASVVLVLTLKSGLMIFDQILSLTDGGPGGATESIAMLIYSHGFAENKFSYSIAEAIVVGAVVCAVSAVQIGFVDKRKVPS